VVTRAAAEALGLMHRYCFALGDVAEDVAAALGHQNPKVKESALLWLADCVPRETKAGVAKLQPGVLPAAAKCTDEGSPSIREAAFAFLAAAALKVRCRAHPRAGWVRARHRLWFSCELPAGS
jgi:cytoskeleton-associated protein 5